MKKTVEELKKALQGLGAEWVEAFDEILAGEGDKYADELAKKNREALNLRTRLRDAEKKVESGQKSFRKLADHIGIDEDAEDIDEALANLKTAHGGGKGTDSETSKRIAKLERLLAEQKAEAEKALGIERQKRQDVLMKDAIKSALVAGKAQKPEVLALALKNRVKFTDDEEIVYEDEAGKQVPVADGIGAFLKANPEFVLSGQLSGSGSGKPGGGDADKGEEARAKAFAEERNKGTAAAGNAVVTNVANPWAAPGTSN